jgi:hypothetical protein
MPILFQIETIYIKFLIVQNLLNISKRSSMLQNFHGHQINQMENIIILWTDVIKIKMFIMNEILTE